MGGTARTGQRRGRRVAVSLAVYLLWGLLLTWVIAWVLATDVTRGVLWRQVQAVERDRLPARVMAVRTWLGGTEVICLDRKRSWSEKMELPDGPSRRWRWPAYADHLESLRPEPRASQRVVLWAYGFPWRALRRELEAAEVPPMPGGKGGSMSAHVRGAVTLPSGWWPRGWRGGRSGPAFPLLPIWPGLLADTVLYGGLVWCWRRAFVVLRGRRRRKKGKCAWRGGCGYDLNGSGGEVCPECGRPVGA